MSRSWFERITIDPKAAKVLKREKLFDDLVEFPVVSENDVGLKHNVSYCTISPCINSILKILATHDLTSGIVRYEN